MYSVKLSQNAEALKESWAWLLTGVVVVAAVAGFFFLPDMSMRSQFGDYLSGFAGAVAFIWLIAAYLQQGNELRLQREELSLQRQSLDLQREELKKMSKYAAMEQVAHLLDQFDRSLHENPNSPVKTANDFPVAFMTGMQLWKTITESPNPNEVFKAYTEWMKIEGPAKEFLARLVTATELYCEASGKNILPQGNSPAERIYFGHQALLDIPYIRHYIGAASTLATAVLSTEPGLDRIQLAGLCAMEKIAPRVVNAQALAALRERVAAHDRELEARKQAQSHPTPASGDA